MAILGLTPVELAALCRCLRGAIASACIPDWEFDSLVGRSRAEALVWVEAGLPAADLDERLLDQVVTMLSMFAGSTEDAHEPTLGTSRRKLGKAEVSRMQVTRAQLELLLEKLCWSADEHTGKQSSVTLRPGVRTGVAAGSALPTNAGRAAARPSRKRGA